MSRGAIALLLAACVALVAQQPRHKKGVPILPPKPAETACHIGSAHNCHCPRMVARENDKVIDFCTKASKDQAQYVACLKRDYRSECAIIQTVDPEHRADACKAACKMDVCRCHDGPACGVHGFDYDAAQQQVPEQ